MKNNNQKPVEFYPDCLNSIGRRFSRPITKSEAVEFFVNCLRKVQPHKKPIMIEHIKNRIDDVQFLKDFNYLMSIRLRMFAPGMYQVVYDYD